ncbi:lipoprotein, putative [Rhodospirillum centenum SW]|uniref:Lipoprotein, putative n=1 Tax=Rhodospirillum centenum (strain ATCC 51521 / SW) TaxID=414684 RepID=B6IU49_RHOCS|nr:lipoprotein, putative [Rhodospirillum centenum SW]
MPRLRVLQPGVADDCAPLIQKALDEVAAAGGGEVVLPPGDWPYRGALTVGGGTVLRGSAGTRLLALDPRRSAVCLRGRFPAVRDLLLDGRATRRSSAGDAAGFRLLRAEEAELDRVRVTRTAAAGIFVQETVGFRITHSTVHGCLADGFHVTAASRYGQILGCRSYDNGDDLFALVGYASNGAPVEHMVIADNIGRNGAARGITCLGARHVAITGNLIHGSAAAGIYLHQETSYDTFAPSWVVVSGNVLRDVARKASHAGLFIGGGRGAQPLKAGGTLSNAIEQVVLSGNLLDGSGHDGLYVSSRARRVTGSGNVVRNVRQGAIRIDSREASVEAVAE